MWNFIKSSTNSKNWLFGHAKEVCFIGRSNVGKSSLINALTNQKALARTSNTPGRTQLINFFQEEKDTIVDLPGYGYAKMPLKVKTEMVKMIQEYFEKRIELVKVFILIDSKVGPTKDDLAMIAYLDELGRDYMLVGTKKDKAKQSELVKTKRKLEEITDDFIFTSSLKKVEIGKLLKIIKYYLK